MMEGKSQVVLFRTINRSGPSARVEAPEAARVLLRMRGPRVWAALYGDRDEGDGAGCEAVPGGEGPRAGLLHVLLDHRG